MSNNFSSYNLVMSWTISSFDRHYEISLINFKTFSSTGKFIEKVIFLYNLIKEIHVYELIVKWTIQKNVLTRVFLKQFYVKAFTKNSSLQKKIIFQLIHKKSANVYFSYWRYFHTYELLDSKNLNIILSILIYKCSFSKLMN